MGVFVTRLRSEFVTSGGVVAFDRLSAQILQDPAITTTYLGPCVGTNVTAEIDMIFETALSGSEITALDALVAGHTGAGLPSGTSWITTHMIDNLGLGGVVVVSFVDATVVAIGSIDLAHERLSTGAGRLISVTVETDANATVTVQRVGNGSAVGSGVSEAMTAGTPFTFELVLSEQEYAQYDTVGIALGGLDMSSDTRISALWDEAA